MSGVTDSFLKYRMYLHLSLTLSLEDVSRPQSRRCRRRDRRGFHGKGSKRTYAPSRARCKGRGRRATSCEGGAGKVHAERNAEGGWEEWRTRRGGGNRGGTRGTSPAASNRKGKTPGERELVFGDIAVAGSSSSSSLSAKTTTIATKTTESRYDSRGAGEKKENATFPKNVFPGEEGDGRGEVFKKISMYGDERSRFKETVLLPSANLRSFRPLHEHRYAHY